VTIKLYLGEGRPAGKAVSVANLGCKAAMNWDWMRLLSGAPEAGVDVWPLVHLTGGSVDRLTDWARAQPISHIMIENEPFTQKNLTPQAAARRLTEEVLPYAAQFCPKAQRVMGGFLIEYPMLYPAIRSQVAELMKAIGRDDDVVAFHLYLPEAPQMSEVTAAAEWFRQQVVGIEQDWPLFAVTEFGVGRASYSGRDVAALGEYMRRTWDALLARDCYAAGWFLCAPNSEHSAYSDMVLCWENGAPKPLGLTYRELPPALPVIEPEPPEPSAEWLVHLDETVISGGRAWNVLLRSKEA